jgi:hypothetical protein
MLDKFMRSFTGYLEPSRYRVKIQTPKVLEPLGVSIVSWATTGLYCHTAELPNKGFATQESVIYGPDRKLPYRAQYADFNCEFYVGASNTNGDNAGQVLEYFRTWQQLIVDENTHDVNYATEYTTDIRVDVLSRKGTGIPGIGSIGIRLPEIFGGDPLAEFAILKNQELKPVYSVVVRNAYPVEVGSVPLSWAGEGVMSVRVTFAYFQWTSAATVTTTEQVNN